MLRAWLESGVENSGTQMLFVEMRGSLSMIAADVGLMVEVARRLEMAARGLKEEKKDVKDLHMNART